MAEEIKEVIDTVEEVVEQPQVQEAVVSEAVVSEVEPVAEAPKEEVKPKKPTGKQKAVDRGEPALTYDIKLSIYENKVVDVPADTKFAVIENLGGGDLYVDANAISFLSHSLVEIGASKEFSGVKKLFVSSASRPTFRVSIFK